MDPEAECVSAPFPFDRFPIEVVSGIFAILALGGVVPPVGLIEGAGGLHNVDRLDSGRLAPGQCRHPLQPFLEG